MRLQLTRPLVFFDLETTGVNVATDRIVEISLVKQFPNGNTESKTWRVNPGMHIPKEASDVHHIMDEDVADMPPFKELAPEVLAFIDHCDLAGYNSNHFDVPMLQEELLRADFDIDLRKDHHFVDAFVIFQKHTPRNLTAAYKHYCGKELVGAHGANADTEATREVLLAQLEKHGDVPTTVEALEEYTTLQKTADLAGRIGYDALGHEVFTLANTRDKRSAKCLPKNPVTTRGFRKAISPSTPNVSANRSWSRYAPRPRCSNFRRNTSTNSNISLSPSGTPNPENCSSER